MLKEKKFVTEICFQNPTQLQTETTYKSVYYKKIEDECIQLEYDFTVNKQIN